MPVSFPRSFLCAHWRAIVQAVFCILYLFTYILHYVLSIVHFRSTWNCSKVNNRWILCCWVWYDIALHLRIWSVHIFLLSLLLWQFLLRLFLLICVCVCSFHVVFLFYSNTSTSRPSLLSVSSTGGRVSRIELIKCMIIYTWALSGSHSRNTQTFFSRTKNTVNFLAFSEIKRWYRFAFIDRRISIHREKWIAFL